MGTLTIYCRSILQAFFKSFLPGKQIADSRQTCEVMNSLQVESRDAVNTFVDTAIKAGAKPFRDPYDHGFMYGRAFEDLDGHIREIFRMDPSQMPGK